VEDVEVIVLDPRTTKVGGGVCACMKGDGVFRISPFANSYNVSINPNLPEGDISRYFVLPILVEEDQRVLPHITTVILAPPSSWVIGVIKLISELGNVGNRTGCGREGDSGVICSKSNGFFTLNIVIQHVSRDFVKDLGDQEEVLNGGIIAKGGGEDLVVKLSVPQNIDCWEEILRPS